MKKKHILFDTDGVIVHSEMFSVQYQKETGITADEMLPFYKGVFGQCITGQADLKEEIKPWLAKWKWEGTVDEFLKRWFNAENNVDDRVIDLIKKLREAGFGCHLATNQEKYRTAFLKDEMGFAELFDTIYSSAELGCKKPNPEFYKHILDDLNKRFGTAPEDVIYLDDDEENVAAAHKLEIKAIQYREFSDAIPVEALLQ